MPLTVDEKSRRAVHPSAGAGQDIVAYSRDMNVPGQIIDECIEIKAYCGSVPSQVLFLQGVLAPRFDLGWVCPFTGDRELRGP